MAALGHHAACVSAASITAAASTRTRAHTRCDAVPAPGASRSAPPRLPAAAAAAAPAPRAVAARITTTPFRATRAPLIVLARGARDGESDVDILDDDILSVADSPGDAVEGVQRKRGNCYGCGVALQTGLPDVNGYVPPEEYETKRVHRQLHGMMLCSRCNDLSHGQGWTLPFAPQSSPYPPSSPPSHPPGGGPSPLLLRICPHPPPPSLSLPSARSLPPLPLIGIFCSFSLHSSSRTLPPSCSSSSP